MNEFKHIPKEMWPDQSQHVDYKEVYRATHSLDVLTNNDFLPWNIEHANQRKTFGNLFKQPEYGMSVYTKLEPLKNIVDKYPKLSASINAYAKGFTTIKRGVSLKESKNNHVEYYLYDYINNNPKDDFKIIEVR